MTRLFTQQTRRQFLVIAGLYLLVNFLLEKSTFASEAFTGESLWYPVTGLTFAFLWLAGPVYLPVTLISAFLSAYFIYEVPVSVVELLILWCTSTLPYGLVVQILREKLHIDPQFKQVRDILWFVGVAAVSSFGVASLNTAVFVLVGLLDSWQLYLTGLFDWWFGDLIGILVVAPVILIYIAPAMQELSRLLSTGQAFSPISWWHPAPTRRWVEYLFQAILIMTISWTAFIWQPLLNFNFLYPYFLFLIWIVLRHGIRGTILAVLVISIGVVFTATVSTAIELLDLRLLLLTLSLVGLLFGVVVTERHATEQQLQHRNQELASVNLAYQQTTEFARRYAEHLEGLRQVSLELTAELDLETLLQSIVCHALKLLRASSGGFFLYRTEEEVIEWLVPTGVNAPPAGVKLRRGEGVSGKVWEQGSPLVVDNYSYWNEQVQQFQHKVVVGVPVQWGEHFLGVLNVSDDYRHQFSEEEIHLLMSLASHAAIAIQNARLIEQLRAYTLDLETRVTERTHALAVANEQLQELDRLKSKFVSDVSHELRTPVTTIGLYLDLLQHGKAERQAQYLQILQLQIGRLRLLIEDILDLSRLELAQDRLNFKPVELNRIVHQVIQTHQSQASAIGLTLQQELAVSLPLIWGEESLLIQALHHLLKNAIHYTLHGGILVCTGLSTQQEQVFLSVQDTGMGIDSVDMPHLFKRFYRGQKVGQLNIPGTGLGLTICQEIVQQHRGTMEVESQLNMGSTFTIWLPVYRSSELETAESTPVAR